MTRNKWLFITALAWLTLFLAWGPSVAIAQEGNEKSGKKQNNSRRNQNDQDDTKKNDQDRTKQPNRNEKGGDKDKPEDKTKLPTTADTLANVKRQPVRFEYNVVREASGYKFEGKNSKNGYVRIQLERGKTSRDDIKRKQVKPEGQMCLSAEEVSGTKIESEIVIPDSTLALGILPGGVIDPDMLLSSGVFVYQNMDLRKPYSVSTTSNLAQRKNVNVEGDRRNGINESKARNAILTLASPANFRNQMPNVGSTSTMDVSTFNESMGLEIGASFFYLGVGAKADFGFSSDKYRYMYLYQFDQTFLPIMADQVNSADDLFTEPVKNSDKLVYIREVKYGRRLYVLVESEYDLEEYSQELKGKANWVAVSGAFAESSSGSKLQSKTNVRIITQGGKFVALTDPAKLQKTVDDYFQSKYSENDIVPLSYTLTYLDGSPVSLVTESFLNGRNCLKSDTIRVLLKEVKLQKTDNDKPQEIYGGAKIKIFGENDQKPAANGTVTFAAKETPLELKPGQSKSYGPNDQPRYFEFKISDLDTVIEISPFMSEKDSLNDDEFSTNDKFKKSVRQILTEATTTQGFELQTKQTNTKLVFEIIPQ
jgi:hypothetical protein